MTGPFRSLLAVLFSCACSGPQRPTALDAGADEASPADAGDAAAQVEDVEDAGPVDAAVPEPFVPVRLAVSSRRSCALGSRGELYCWGLEYFEETTDPPTIHISLAARRVNWNEPFTMAASASATTLAAQSEGLVAWDDVRNPALIDSTGRWSLLAAGEEHACGVRDGELVCWGSNEAGQLGNGTHTPLPEITRVVEGTGWQAIASASKHTCAVRSGELLCWGDNSRGQLGTGNMEPSTVPVRIGIEESRVGANASGDA